uniref:Peptidase A1 domain-containing protein n=1 Tax=Heligmosomoides polygyrus TaxID=6339 RepID=A0A8L8Q2J1_HELPZ
LEHWMPSRGTGLGNSGFGGGDNGGFGTGGGSAFSGGGSLLQQSGGSGDEDGFGGGIDSFRHKVDGDRSAALENGALAVTKCKPVNTTNVFTNHNVNNTCYSLLPLEIGDHIWFSVPGTKDLVSYSPEIHCPYMPPRDHQSSQQLLYPSLIDSDKIKPFIFNSPLIYHSINQNFAHSSRYQLQFLQQEYEKLESRLRRRGVLESTTGIITGIQSIGSTVSKSFQSVYDTTTQKFSSGVESIRWSIISLVMWITIPTLIIIVLAVFCIYYTKLCLLRRASATAASAFRCFNLIYETIISKSTQLCRKNFPNFNSSSTNHKWRRNCYDRTVELHVRIASSSLTHSFYVSADDQCPAPILLGSDFIRNLNK